MPYIPQLDRVALTPVSERVPTSTGELNFQISLLLESYIRHNGKSYGTCSSAVAACQDAADEFKRRVLAPYEDSKIAENGDVYNNIT